MKKKSLSIAIIGCGIGGLAAACYLKRNGHQITVYERFEKPKPVGAGLMLQPTGLACLADLGLDLPIIETSAKIRHLDGRTIDSKVVFDLDYSEVADHYFGLGTHRSVIFNILYQTVLSLDIPIQCDCDIINSRLINNSRILIDTMNNEHGLFDLVIDASGRQSKLRSNLGKMKYNQPYPFGAVWGLLNDPDQRFGKDILQQRFHSTKVMIGALPVGRRLDDTSEQIAFFWSLPLHQYQEWLEQDISIWQQQVSKYWPEITPLITQFTSTSDLTLAIYNDVIMKQCYEERLLFIGDAAHATSPQLGQGANLALLDAYWFSKILENNDSITSSLHRFAKHRRKQVHFYQTASRWLTPFFQSDKSCFATIRNFSFGPMCKTPYLKTEMMRTLSGVKTGLLTSMDLGKINDRYSCHSAL